MIFKALGQNPSGWAVIDLVTEWSMICNTPFSSDGKSDRPNPINRLVMSSPSTYMFYPNCTFKSALAASFQPLSFRCEKVVAESQLHWEKRNLNSAENLKLAMLKNLPSTQVYCSCIPVSTKANAFSPWYIPNTSWTPLGVEDRANEKYTASMVSSNKKTKQIRLGRISQQTFSDSLFLNFCRRSA